MAGNTEDQRIKVTVSITSCLSFGVPPWLNHRVHLQCRRREFDPGLRRSLEEGVATHFRILARRIPRTEEPGGLLSMKLRRVGHN